MGLIEIDVSNTDELLQQRRLMPNGKYVFEIAKELIVVPCNEPSTNSKVELELRCISDGEYKGSVVFDRIIIVPPENTTAKAQTTRKINAAKLAQLSLSSGVFENKEALAASGGNIPLDAFKGRTVEAQIKTIAAKGDYDAKNEVGRYLFVVEE